MALQLYEPVSRSEGAHSLADVLARPIPNEHQRFEQSRFLADARTAMHEALRARLHSNSSAAAAANGLDTEGVRQFRSRLSTYILDNAEQMGDRIADDIHLVVGWSRLALAWTLLCYTNVLLRRSTGNRETFFVPGDHEFLCSSELIVTGNTLAVSEYRASELVASMQRLRARIERLESLDGVLARYVCALEMRTAELIVFGHDKSSGVHNVERWRVNDARCYKASRALVTGSAWWFVVVKRVLRDYIETGRPAFFGADLPHPALPLERLRIANAELLARFWTFVYSLAANYNSDRHASAFKTTAAPYAAPLGEVRACDRMRTDNESVDWRGAITSMSSGPAADYVARAKFKTKLAKWLDALAFRRRHNDARPVMGTDGLFEEIALLHVMRVFFRDQFNVPFDEWFVIMHRHDGEVRDYQLRLLRSLAVPSPRPMIVQRLGRFGVLVPADDSRRPMTMGELERQVFTLLRIDLEQRTAPDDDANAVLYEFADAFEALVAWFVFIDVGWQGALHSDKTCAELCAQLMGHRDAEETASATAVLAIGLPAPPAPGTIAADF